MKTPEHSEAVTFLDEKPFILRVHPEKSGYKHADEPFEYRGKVRYYQTPHRKKMYGIFNDRWGRSKIGWGETQNEIEDEITRKLLGYYDT